MIPRTFAGLLCLLLLGGCASTGTRSLTEAELGVLNNLQARLQENRKKLGGALDDLEAVAGAAITDQHSLALSISKAKLLESMKSPWVNPHPDLAATQKEVAFYHLFALAEAERELLNARLNQRQASLDELAKAYDRLATLTGQIIESEKIILAHLNQPVNAQIGSFLTTLLAETKAFRESLAGSDNPRLQALAKDVEKAEARVGKAQELIQGVLGKTLEEGGDHEP